MPNRSSFVTDYPCVKLTHGPTPFEFMPNLTRELNGPKIFVKRDDCTGLALGGNKTRQLEYYFGEARVKDCDTVLITGAVQSNFVRSTAAAAAKLGMACEVQLEERVKGASKQYHESGNVLLDKILGAKIHSYPEGEDEAGADAALEKRADALRKKGKSPYVIHLGANHPPLGSLGYIDVGQEILDDARDAKVQLDAIVVPSGSAATHSGLLAGLRLIGSSMPVLGVCVRRDAKQQKERVEKRTQEVFDMLYCGKKVAATDVEVTDATLAPGYGKFGKDVKEAIHLAARLEGLLVDPVYSGKTLAGLIHAIRKGVFKKGQSVCFLHTGGAPSLWAYESQLTG